MPLEVDGPASRLATRVGRLQRFRDRIPPGAFVLAALSIADVVLGFIREAIVAYYFGASAELDAFLIASTVPRILVIQGVQITVALILPLYIGHIEEGRPDLATALMQRWFRFLLKSGLVFAVGAGLLAPYLMALVGPGLSDDLTARAAEWFRFLLPWVLLSLLGGCFKVVLESNKRFVPAALGGDAINITVMASCLLFASLWSVWAMVVGMLAGAVLGFLIQWWPSRRFEPLLLWPGRLATSIQLPLAGGGVLVMHYFVQQANMLIDRAFASSLPEGSVAALNYANQINQAPSTVVNAALATALFPILARLAARRQWRQAFRTAMSLAVVTMTIGVLCAAGLIIFRAELVTLLLERGRFDAHASAMTALVLSLLPAMIPVYAGTLLVTRLLMSQKRLRTILMISIFSMSLKILLNIAFVRIWGLIGVVLATVMTGTAALLVRILVAWKTVPPDEPAPMEAG